MSNCKQRNRTNGIGHDGNRPLSNNKDCAAVIFLLVICPIAVSMSIMTIVDYVF